MVRESDFSVQSIGIEVGQGLARMSQVVIDEIPRVKEVQALRTTNLTCKNQWYRRLLSPDHAL